MQSDTIILSILDRYENNLPVTPDEKAVLHTWLKKELRNGDFTRPNPPTCMKIRKIRKTARIWQCIWIILTLLVILITLYMFAAKGYNRIIIKSDDHIHSYYPAIRKAG